MAKLEDKIKQINLWLDSLLNKLDEKYNNALIIVACPEKPSDFLESYNKIVTDINHILSIHNERVNNHKIEVITAREKLELHTIETALLAQDYKKIISELMLADASEKQAREALQKNEADILLFENKTSDVVQASIKINKHLREFFGKEEIILVPDDGQKGYIIRRNGKPAVNLSEGEKTAIAFSYFIVKVEEKDFKIKEGIIFIDDPISSFDSNFIYHCFSLINTYFKDVGQLFVSTHNFQLFNLLKDWFVGNNQNRERKGKDRQCEFYMTEPFNGQEKRLSKIIVLDKTLRNFKSEYHFLFSLLNKFKDADLEYEDLYTIGNVARRYFDIFADFKIPDSRDQKSKMEEIVKELNRGKTGDQKISDADWNRAYKLVNELSHNYDPLSSIEHQDKSENKAAIEILLNIVREADPRHYLILENSLL